jgi:CheY-like chemotaxis protein
MPEASPLHVLLCDDEEDILELLGEYLRARGYRVSSAVDGEDALEQVRVGGVDLLLTDLQVPGLDGLALLQAVQRSGRATGVLLMTGYGTVETAVAALQGGAREYLLKPFRLREVAEALERAAARGEADAEAARARARCAALTAAAELETPDGWPGVYAACAEAARSEARAAEAAVFVRDEGAWIPVARSGPARDLRRFDPDKPVPPGVELAFAAVAGQARVAIAVAPAAPGAARALHRLGQAVAGAWLRVGRGAAVLG